MEEKSVARRFSISLRSVIACFRNDYLGLFSPEATIRGYWYSLPPLQRPIAFFDFEPMIQKAIKSRGPISAFSSSLKSRRVRTNEIDPLCLGGEGEKRLMRNVESVSIRANDWRWCRLQNTRMLEKRWISLYFCKRLKMTLIAEYNI